jgi:hypothetical protein
MSFVFNIEQEEFVFIHIPKTGGSALQEYFNKYNRHNLRPNKNFVGHFSYLETLPLFGDDKKRLYFAIAHNPWDRMVSFYYFLKKSPDVTDSLGMTTSFKDGLSFNDFISHVVNSDNRFFRPQYDYITDGQTGIIDEVLKLENINNDVAVFCEKYGFKNIKVHKNNTTSHKHYREYYNDESINKILKYESEIIKLLNYKF